MDKTPVLFGADAARQIIKAVRHVDRRFNGMSLESTPQSSHADPGPVSVVVEVIADEDYPTSGGFYYGKFIVVNGPVDPSAAPPFEDADDQNCLVFDVNGAVLKPNKLYRGHVVSDVDGDVLAVVAVGLLPLNTQNVDGTAVKATTVDIRADQDTFIRFVTVPEADPDPEYQKLEIDVEGLKGELSLTTGNTADAGAQDSTTTLLRFADPTGIKVIKGATDPDPDIVYLTFGQTITFVECVSLTTTSADGYLTSATQTVKTRTMTVLDGATIGPALCEENPAVCCEPGVTFGGCAHVYPTTIYGTWGVATGDCGCFTGSFALNWNATTNKWEGTFTGCTGDVDVTITVDDFAAPVVWIVTIAGVSYTFSFPEANKGSICGDLPVGIKIGVEGGCTGVATLAFSE